MSSRVVDIEQQRTKRELRLRIGRLRRRIDNRFRAGRREARRLISWRTYVSQYPRNAILGALGVGLSFSAGLTGRRLLRWLGLRILRRGMSRITEEAWRELGRIWADSTPVKNPTQTSGADDDQS